MWVSWSYASKFSLIAFLVSGFLGLFSMGALGYGLYYLVKPILGNRIDELQGDAMWPSLILAGMGWSVSFLMAGWLFSFLSRFSLPPFISYLSYVLVLWIWVLVVWFTIIHFKVVN
jgi:hypothetical protein